LCLTPNAFDIILMDVQMPEMDGIETNQLNRQQLSLDRLPIVALTAGTLVQEKKRAFDSGINDF
jgi:CheY-like chemotaxis protein